MSSIPFNRKSLARAVASCCVLGTSAAAMAQQGAEAVTGEPMVLEEVVVTGIRGSLQRSMDVKRMGQGVVDAISATEIGKMPDTNLAESLQRVTGVSIDRVNGEGSEVTVRGFGPDYNVITLNGRQMPAATLEETTASASRSFDFSQLDSETIGSGHGQVPPAHSPKRFCQFAFPDAHSLVVFSLGRFSRNANHLRF